MMKIRKQKWYHVSLDRPGAGWSETLPAKNLKQAVKLANDKHQREPPADTYYEIQQPEK